MKPLIVSVNSTDLTEWIEGTTPPVRSGVYQRRFKESAGFPLVDNEEDWAYSWFDANEQRWGLGFKHED